MLFRNIGKLPLVVTGGIDRLHLNCYEAFEFPFAINLSKYPVEGKF